MKSLPVPPNFERFVVAKIVPTLNFLNLVNVSIINPHEYSSKSSTYRKWGILSLSVPGLPSVAHIINTKKNLPNPWLGTPPISVGLVHISTTSPFFSTSTRFKFPRLLQIISRTEPALNNSSSCATAKCTYLSMSLRPVEVL